ncbi:MAG: protease modulator HflC, partial [Pseudomonadota bacterium]
MQKILVPLGVILALALVVLLNSFYIVRVDQQALLLQFGAVQEVVNAPTREETEGGVEFGQNIAADNEAGLRFKLPFIQNSIYFDKKNLGFDLPPQEITAADQERLIVDAFVRWKIVDPLQFYRSANNEAGGRAQLRGIMGAALREVLGNVDTPDIISGQRAALMDAIRDILNRGAAQYGIEIVDVRIKRADLPRDNSEGVFARMRTEREQQAAQIRAEGQEESLRIRAEADRTVAVTLATATEEGQKIRGEGDAQRNAVFASAYNLDTEFFSF